MALLHEMKRLLKSIVTDTAGNAADSVVKLYDRDDFSNAVVTQGSSFTNDHPWFVFFGATHLEDVHAVFGAPAEDSLAE